MVLHGRWCTGHRMKRYRLVSRTPRVAHHSCKFWTNVAAYVSQSISHLSHAMLSLNRQKLTDRMYIQHGPAALSRYSTIRLQIFTESPGATAPYPPSEERPHGTISYTCRDPPKPPIKKKALASHLPFNLTCCYANNLDMIRRS